MEKVKYVAIYRNLPLHCLCTVVVFTITKKFTIETVIKCFRYFTMVMDHFRHVKYIYHS